ncbi:uncharacterized protein LOC144153233 [Haemaphysalis longicornis]
MIGPLALVLDKKESFFRCTTLRAQRRTPHPSQLMMVTPSLLPMSATVTTGTAPSPKFPSGTWINEMFSNRVSARAQCTLWVSEEYKDLVPTHCLRQFHDICGVAVPVRDSDLCPDD